jgi:hypothetical protein
LEVTAVVRAVGAGLGLAAPTAAEAADAVFALPPSGWDGGHYRLLALAGLALWPRADGRPDPERRRPGSQESKRCR